jgi:hypothetical protein
MLVGDPRQKYTIHPSVNTRVERDILLEVNFAVFVAYKRLALEHFYLELREAN